MAGLECPNLSATTDGLRPRHARRSLATYREHGAAALAGGHSPHNNRRSLDGVERPVLRPHQQHAFGIDRFGADTSRHLEPPAFRAV